MTGLLVHGDQLTRYDFGPDHPMAPGRVQCTISLAEQLGVLDRLRWGGSAASLDDGRVPAAYSADLPGRSPVVASVPARIAAALSATRSLTATVMPPAASRAAIAAPIPCPAPVTSATVTPPLRRWAR